MSQSQGFSMFFGEWKMPLDITLLAVDDRGHTIGAGRPEINFNFRYRDLTFTVHFREDGPKASMDLSTWLGSYPYSAESSVRRQALSAIMRGANKDLGKVMSAHRGKIGLRVVLPIPTPVTAVRMTSALALFLVPLKPYLDLMAMVYQMPCD